MLARLAQGGYPSGRLRGHSARVNRHTLELLWLLERTDTQREQSDNRNEHDGAIEARGADGHRIV